jgi:hypothetical protein
MFKYVSIVIFIFWLLLAVLPAGQSNAATATIFWRSVQQDTAGLPISSPIYYYVYRDTIPSFQPDKNNFFAATRDTFVTDRDSRLTDPAINLFYVVKALDAWGNESRYSSRIGKVPFVLTRARVLLQSAFDANADSMTCSFKNLDLLPFLAPYAESRRHASVLAGQTVDWVLVQMLHPGTQNVAGQKSFFLKSDGCISELDGSNDVLGIPGMEPGHYQLRIRHRNHLSITSRQAVLFGTEGAELMDFTTDSSFYAQSRSACPLKPGVWGMWAGDVTQDMVIDQADLSRLEARI